MSEVAAWLDPDPADLGLLPDVIQAATDALVDIMNCDPRAQDYIEYRNGTGGSVMGMNRSPIQRVRKVLMPDRTVDIAQVTWDDYAIYYAAGFPRGQRNVTVYYTAGYDDLPSPIRQACLYTIKAMWLARRVDPNATSESFAGVLSQSFYPTGAGTVPPSARDLVRNYVTRFVSQ